MTQIHRDVDVDVEYKQVSIRNRHRMQRFWGLTSTLNRTVVIDYSVYSTGADWPKSAEIPSSDESL